MQLVLILALLTAVPDQKNCRTVCGPAKHKVVVHRPHVAVRVLPVVPVVVQEQAQGQSQQVIVNVNINQPTATYTPKAIPQVPWGVLGLRGAIGVWDCGPNVFALVGLRARFPTVYLGAEINTSFFWATVLIYLSTPFSVRRQVHL